jgi:probable phosphoglycerate mutase
MFSGDLDPGLAPSGVVQAQALVKRLSRFSVETIYASPKLRVRMTAEPTAAALGLTPILEDGLKEIGYGAWEGKMEKDVRAREQATFDAWVADPAAMSPQGGETAVAIAARAMPVVDRIVLNQKDRDVLVFSHKATIRIIACTLLGIPLSRFRDRISCPTASVTTFTFGAHGPLLERLGEPI